MTREKVIDGLRKAAEELARYAPMKVNGRCQMYFDGAIHLLKEQEAQTVLSNRVCESAPCRYIRKGFCPKCHQEVEWLLNRNYCGFCGQAVKWDA